MYTSHPKAACWIDSEHGERDRRIQRVGRIGAHKQPITINSNSSLHVILVFFLLHNTIKVLQFRRIGRECRVATAATCHVQWWSGSETSERCTRHIPTKKRTNSTRLTCSTHFPFVLVDIGGDETTEHGNKKKTEIGEKTTWKRSNKLRLERKEAKFAKRSWDNDQQNLNNQLERSQNLPTMLEYLQWIAVPTGSNDYLIIRGNLAFKVPANQEKQKEKSWTKRKKKRKKKE